MFFLTQSTNHHIDAIYEIFFSGQHINRNYLWYSQTLCLIGSTSYLLQTGKLTNEKLINSIWNYLFPHINLLNIYKESVIEQRKA